MPITSFHKIETKVELEDKGVLEAILCLGL